MCGLGRPGRLRSLRSFNSPVRVDKASNYSSRAAANQLLPSSLLIVLFRLLIPIDGLRFGLGNPPGSLIRELAGERSHSRSRVPGFKPRKRQADAVVSYPQFPTIHRRAALPSPAATTARDLELFLYRLRRFQCTPFFRARPLGTIRFLPLHTLVRTLNQAAAPFPLGNVRGHELLL